MRYVALGDSYTIGTSVSEAERWPNQLVARLAAARPRLDRELEVIANLGVDGFASADVIEVELPRLDHLEPEFASLLIGVNDVVQGVAALRFETNATMIVEALLERLAPDRIVVVTTPDYTVTPQGAAYGEPVQRRAGIRTNNGILSRIAEARGIAVADIFDLSARAETDRSLVADDGLHPSGAQYALWVDRIAPIVAGLLRARQRAS